MTIFNYAPAERSHSPVTLTVILYWLVRGLTFVIAILLGLYILAAAFVALPFYAAEGYSPQFEDRVFGVIGDFLLCIAIVIPHRWSMTRRGLVLRIAMIVLAVSWILIVDMVAFNRGLSTMVFTASGLMAVLVAAALLVTLLIQSLSTLTATDRSS